MLRMTIECSRVVHVSSPTSGPLTVARRDRATAVVFFVANCDHFQAETSRIITDAQLRSSVLVPYGTSALRAALDNWLNLNGVRCIATFRKAEVKYSTLLRSAARYDWLQTSAPLESRVALGINIIFFHVWWLKQLKTKFNQSSSNNWKHNSLMVFKCQTCNSK